MPPNVLLVVLDAARRDAIEPYRPGALTPAIADLARRGAAHPHAYATSSWTLPSHASIFTGRLPRELGLCQPPDGTPQSARPALQRAADRLLPHVLGRAGYATRGFSANLWASGHAGFDIGFERFLYLPSARAERSDSLTASGPRARLTWAREGLRSRGDDGAAGLGDALRTDIAEWSGRPTFWFVNLVECHSPYLPPRPWNDLGPAGRVRAALDSHDYLSFESICRHVAGAQWIPDESMARMRHLYDRSVAYMDDWLAGVLESLDQRGILEQTLVIVTSDHGENFGEHGLIAHGFSLDERLIHVPLVMAGPGALADSAVFSLAGLPRVIGDAAGLPSHPWSRDELPAGVALAEYDAIGPADHPRVQEFARKWDLSAEGVRRLTASYDAATDGEHKLLVSHGAESVYDLRADPGERSPLGAGQTNGATAALREALAQVADNPSGATAKDASSATSGVGSSGAPAPSDADLAQLEQQMKLLGYM